MYDIAADLLISFKCHIRTYFAFILTMTFCPLAV